MFAKLVFLDVAMLWASYQGNTPREKTEYIRLGLITTTYPISSPSKKILIGTTRIIKCIKAEFNWARICISNSSTPPKAASSFPPKIKNEIVFQRVFIVLRLVQRQLAITVLEFKQLICERRAPYVCQPLENKGETRNGVQTSNTQESIPFVPGDTTINKGATIERLSSNYVKQKFEDLVLVSIARTIHFQWDKKLAGLEQDDKVLIGFGKVGRQMTQTLLAFFSTSS